MNNNFLSKIKKILAFLVIAGILIFLSYLIVYKASILPAGYDLEVVQKDRVTLKSYNIIGLETARITQTFTGNEIWKSDDIIYEIDRQKSFLWILFSAFFISLFLFFYKLRKGLKFWKAVFDSNIIFSVLLPIFPLINSINRITYLIS